MGGLRGQEILIIVILLIIVFGWKKLPDAARSLGRSARVFKSEVEELKKDGKDGAGEGTVHSQASDQPQEYRPQQQVTPPPPVQDYQAPQPGSYQPQPAPQAQEPPAQTPQQQYPDDPTRPVA